MIFWVWFENVVFINVLLWLLIWLVVLLSFVIIFLLVGFFKFWFFWSVKKLFFFLLLFFFWLVYFEVIIFWVCELLLISLFLESIGVELVCIFISGIDEDILKECNVGFFILLVGLGNCCIKFFVRLDK